MQIEDCSKWSEPEDQDLNQNIFYTLSHNLRKYETNYRINRKKMVKKQSADLNEVYNISKKIKNQDKENIPDNEQNKKSRLFNNLALKTYCQSRQEQRAPRPISRKRAIKTRHQERDTENNSVKIRQIKFERKDKKKFKDKCVDIFANMQSNKEKVSLKKLDQINKNGKDQKMELFLKLFRR